MLDIILFLWLLPTYCNRHFPIHLTTMYMNVAALSDIKRGDGVCPFVDIIWLYLTRLGMFFHKRAGLSHLLSFAHYPPYLGLNYRIEDGKDVYHLKCPVA